jgi:glycoprotein endo-alpha-1,2-mannosidase
MAPHRLLLAFHYAWYGTPYGPARTWRHWTGGQDRHYNPDLVYSGRRMIDAPHYPLDGLYDSLDPVVIDRQLAQLRQSEIDASIVSWWGRDDYSEQVLAALVDRSALTDYKVTIYYETPMVARRKGTLSEAQLIFEDLHATLASFGSRQSWLTVDTRPVVVVYRVDLYPLTTWQEAKDRLRAEGIDVFFLGDTFNVEALAVMDGLHTYNPLRRLVSGEDLAATYARVAEDVHREEKLFAATVIPGFDDRKIRSPGTVLTREDGGCYNRTWHAALSSDPDWILVTSWNEWHEGSEIEPSLDYGTEYLWLTAQWSRAFKARKNRE